MISIAITILIVISIAHWAAWYLNALSKMRGDFFLFFSKCASGGPKVWGFSKSREPQLFFYREFKFCRNLHAFWKAFNKSNFNEIQPTFRELSTKFSFLFENFQRKSSCFHRACDESQLAFGELQTKVSLLQYFCNFRQYWLFIDISIYRYMVNLKLLKNFSKIIKTACLLSRIRIIISAMKMIIW